PFLWNPGQHMAIIGMTDSGKSTLISRLTEDRAYLLVLRTKLDSVKWPRTRVITKAAQLDDPRIDRCELRPAFERQQYEFAHALEKVWKMGAFTVVVDETHMVDGELGLRPLLNRLLQQGRDPGRISMVCGMQRPSTVTRFAIGEASHVVSFGLEGRDVTILEQATNKRMGEGVEDLPDPHFAWMSRKQRKALWTGRLNLKSGQLIGRSV